jgi:hypothetical protein
MLEHSALALRVDGAAPQLYDEFTAHFSPEVREIPPQMNAMNELDNQLIADHRLLVLTEHFVLECPY